MRTVVRKRVYIASQKAQYIKYYVATMPGVLINSNHGSYLLVSPQIASNVDCVGSDIIC